MIKNILRGSELDYLLTHTIWLPKKYATGHMGSAAHFVVKLKQYGPITDMFDNRCHAHIMRWTIIQLVQKEESS